MKSFSAVTKAAFMLFVVILITLLAISCRVDNPLFPPLPPAAIVQLKTPYLATVSTEGVTVLPDTETLTANVTVTDLGTVPAQTITAQSASGEPFWTPFSAPPPTKTRPHAEPSVVNPPASNTPTRPPVNSTPTEPRPADTPTEPPSADTPTQPQVGNFTVKVDVDDPSCIGTGEVKAKITLKASGGGKPYSYSPTRNFFQTYPSNTQKSIDVFASSSDGQSWAATITLPSISCSPPP